MFKKLWGLTTIFERNQPPKPGNVFKDPRISWFIPENLLSYLYTIIIRQVKHCILFKPYIMTNAASQNEATKKVLIVEDEGEMCLLLNILLDGKDLELDHVKDLLSAAEYLQKKQPSVVILDNKLPDGFGVDFISFIKKNYPSIKILMISGYDISVKDLALENGADMFLEKPFSKDQIYQSITQLL
jgi:two-component system OmpR family response regulator